MLERGDRCRGEADVAHRDLDPARGARSRTPVDEGARADELRRKQRGGAVVEVLGSADLLEPSGVHQPHAGRDRQRLVLVVGDQDEGGAELGLDAQEFLPDLMAHVAVEGRHRLVEEERPRAADQRPADSHPLLLPAGKLRRVAPLEPGEADERQHLADPPVDLGGGRPRLPVGRQPKAEVLGDGQMREQRVALEDDVERTVLGREAGDVAPGHQDPPGVGHFESGQHPEQGGLAASRGADEAEERAARQSQRDVVDRDDGAIALGHALDDDVRGMVGDGHPHRRVPRTAAMPPLRRSATAASAKVIQGISSRSVATALPVGSTTRRSLPMM